MGDTSEVYRKLNSTLSKYSSLLIILTNYVATKHPD